ncbi:MAG: protease modulator HflC [Firmicutes bacterium]|nr:protease modulator HflC [Bacillota bacterium]MBO2521376.1 protease modulator HflC [Bacillota bacterium]
MWPIAALIVVIAAALLLQSVFVVQEGQQAIVLQFGEHIRTIKEPGLHFRLPFLQTVHYFESRVLMADGRADEYLTLDKKRLVVDHIARWRIVDPLTFYQTVRTEAGALARLDQIIGSRLREEIARHEFIQVIREQREQIMRAVTDETEVLARQFGIEVLDVRIKRLDLPAEVQESVFARMEAERHRIALRYRAEGEEAAREIRASADKEREIILAAAYEQAERIRGEGDARATRIYAEAYSRDPDFYAFLRRMEAYQDIIPSKTTLVLGSDSALLRHLEHPAGP